MGAWLCWLLTRMHDERPDPGSAEIKTKEGKLFLCVVMDLYSNIIAGWSMHHRQDRHMVLRAVEMAVWQREGDGKIILHSDRGSQFTSGDFQRYLKQQGLVC